MVLWIFIAVRLSIRHVFLRVVSVLAVLWWKPCRLATGALAAEGQLLSLRFGDVGRPWGPSVAGVLLAYGRQRRCHSLASTPPPAWLAGAEEVGLVRGRVWASAAGVGSGKSDRARLAEPKDDGLGWLKWSWAEKI